jgi:sugar/nucleoside kinase (ribokinase family)
MTKKIIAIGNAIVDIVCSVDDAFLENNALVKGSMSLIDEKIAEKLSKLKVEKITSGGSASNTIAALSQFGKSAAFIGRVGDDEFGARFVREIEKDNASFIGAVSRGENSGKSFILVTPDAQRTMCTFLGCAPNISQDLVNEKDFKNLEIFYTEGYLWDSGQNSATLRRAIDIAKNNGAKIAFSLSDAFCVSRHKKDFLELVSSKIDILFANENEALELVEAQNFEDKKLRDFFNQAPEKIFVVTRSEKGCAIFYKEKIVEIPSAKIDKIIDSTGAGDAFAAGFLNQFLENQSLENCGKFGNELAGKIIQQFGARF